LDRDGTGVVVKTEHEFRGLAVAAATASAACEKGVT